MASIPEYWRRLKARMLREPLPPEDIAAGWALGVFIGCSVPFGLQLIISIPLAMMMRVSDAGMLMPPKSTWFEPKLRSGLFIRRV